MSKSKETYSKKEVHNRQMKKRKEKESKRLEKKGLGEKKGFEDMLAWVDESGLITSVPPDQSGRKEIKAETIEVGIPKAELRKNMNQITHKGKVINFDANKGYGFILDEETNESIFVHRNDCTSEVQQDDKVEFETARGQKGIKAVGVVKI